MSAEVLLPAGTYAVISALAVTWIGPQTASDPTVFSASPVATTTFEKVGSAKAKADGAAKKFVATDKAVKCTKAKLGAKFTGAAGKVKGGVIEKAIFRVNGKKVKTVKKPKKGHKVKLKKVPGPVDTHLKVTVRYARGGTATLTRTYWSCS